jgi:hypothetical protein
MAYERLVATRPIKLLIKGAKLCNEQAVLVPEVNCAAISATSPAKAKPAKTPAN